MYMQDHNKRIPERLQPGDDTSYTLNPEPQAAMSVQSLCLDRWNSKVCSRCLRGGFFGLQAFVERCGSWKEGQATPSGVRCLVKPCRPRHCSLD